MPPRAAQCPAVYLSAPQCSPVPPHPGALAPAPGLCTCANGALHKSRVLHLHLHQPQTWHVRLYKPEHRTGLCTSPKHCTSLSPAPKLAQAFTQAPTFSHPLAQAPPLSDPLTPPAQGRAGVGVGPAPLKPAARSSPPLFLQLPVPLPAPTDSPSPSAPPRRAPSLHPSPAPPSPPAPDRGGAAVGLLRPRPQGVAGGWGFGHLGRGGVSQTPLGHPLLLLPAAGGSAVPAATSAYLRWSFSGRPGDGEIFSSVGRCRDTNHHTWH